MKNLIRTFFLILSISGCGSPSKSCIKDAKTICNARTNNTAESSSSTNEAMVIRMNYPQIKEKAPSNGCVRSYPPPYGLSNDLTCTYALDDNGVLTNIPLTPRISDESGQRVFSCIDDQGNALATYTQGSSKATFTLAGQTIEGDCETLLK